ncbi:LysR family transcriptional regulator [Cryomorpha ignava]|uniref:LysR family transcriptional regulator n=1 Tax=Cryomorpha ignava TaxID=101383 RepID=A0A7K3WM11_9FLAO|nr:LysR substrate-binding domain-containing protein [Cryomorpha ignava]NEN22504.1 LysR family transcriptional regulator [Cryomorpha ignava]
MTLIQLKYIVAVDTYRHFATAADHCFVTQPTLSMQISKLEKELDILIFDRSKHPVQPTEIGKKILLQAKLALTEANRIDEIVKASKGQISGEFRLGIIPTVSPALLPRFLRKITNDFPDIHLKIEELQTDQILEKLDKDQLDAGILATPLEKARIIEKPLYYEPFMAYIPKGHRLEKESFVLHSELQLRDILLLKNGHCFRDNIINLCDGAFAETGNANNLLEFESGNFETLVKLSNQGFGMTLIPYLTALDLNEADRANLKPIDHPQPTREISLIYSRAQLKISIINILEAEIKKLIPKKLLEKADNDLISPLHQ